MTHLQKEDLEMLQKIRDAGFTVERASELRKEGKLPPELAKAWDEYDEWLRKHIEERSRAGT